MKKEEGEGGEPHQTRWDLRSQGGTKQISHLGTEIKCELLEKLHVNLCPLLLTYTGDQGARSLNEVTQSLDWDPIGYGILEPRCPLCCRCPKVQQEVGVSPQVETSGMGVRR